ncbi:MBL fold metallo-hydrolase [Parabacteroides gordonii]|jgi:glyoxylase-like metal-dependent hydrolase (beta-lactamase superfamily II)|uniref:MBL fold metallo-hydrolase n=1 Tax=Parabacteroides gordonii TaxID=574930 RepID=UPI000EE22843|nr:MBL fold metallo-hydrolase [Parabacteroides gordonii]RGP16120.1 MBL fold metallo-hydrolase [Parabacteroides gordonii]
MEIDLIDTGCFYADGGAMFGAIPKTAWSRRYPSNEKNGCILTMRSLLISKYPEKIILVDNGAGNKHLDQLSYYNFFNLVDLEEELRKKGITPEQVTDVILTHLHFDHCGYSTRKEEKTGELYPSFPNATHWVSRKQWENFLHPNPLEKDSYFMENMQAIADKGLLRLIDTDTKLCPDIELRIFDGHTPGQIVPYITTSEQTFVFAGDVIPLVASVSPEWISAYDTYPVTSYQEKVRMLEEAAREGQVLIYCHDAYTKCSTVKKVNNFYKKDRLVDI